MKVRLKYVLLFFVTLLSCVVKGEMTFQYGLSFNSYEVEKDERTSLNLTSEAPLNFNNGFIIEFDVSFKKIFYSFGYVFRIIGENNSNIDLLLSRTSKSDVLEPQFTAIYNSGQVLSNYVFKDLGADFDEWIKVKLFVDSKNGMFRLTINDQEFEKTESYFKNFRKINIVFGKNDLNHYETSDVPKMSIRDIVIKNISGKDKYHWRLGKHTHTGVYDDLKRHFASTKNPKWLLDDHSFWKIDTVFIAEANPQIAFNRKENTIAIAGKKSFFIYDLKHQTLTKHKDIVGVPQGNLSNNMEYSPLDQKFFTYDFKNKTASFDIASKTWENNLLYTEEPEYWHHNRSLVGENNALYTFGGYGFHNYKNDIHKYDFQTELWEKVDYKGDTISPRYLAGLGMLDEKIALIFGGYGSKKGRQELSPHNYYDLYSYNFETNESHKLWELKAGQHNFVVANSLVVDAQNKCFYALCFPHQKFNSSLQLYRFSSIEPTYEIIADSIPYSFSDLLSYADLYLSSDSDKMVALTSYTDEGGGQATISIYTLAFHPLSNAELFQAEENFNSTRIYMLIGFVALILLAFLWWRYKNKSNVVSTFEDEQESEAYDPIVGIKPINENAHKQAILLFGGFQVIDKEGKNITGEFTPMLKHLFLLILLYTLKNGKGISFVKLKEALWFDMNEENANNNRGVALSKIRKILENVGEMQFKKHDSYWSVKFENEIYCDYYEALVLINEIKGNKDLNIDYIKRLLSIVSKGELLPSIQIEWIDTFKSEFSNELVDLLVRLIHQKETMFSDSLYIDIANALFIHDPLNEDALSLKCSVLVKMGKNGLAKNTYTTFTKEYEAWFGTKYKYSFNQVIS